MVPKEEIPVIKVCYQKSVAPRALAYYYNVPLQEILDILQLPHDLKKMERMHREKNFYDHGKGDKQFELRVEAYGTFLHDGDFEKYQKYCYMSKYNPLFWIGKFSARRIKQSEDINDEVRRFWILNRFESYQDTEWEKLNQKILKLSEKMNPNKTF